ncbi:conserved Plasmodium protein, unknown function [Plasmodium berghei]|uniref:Uncharacterized protein n=2 Tax=Plasmodium berghei TaxID=5821 RepID=A0A509ANX3_PLABA|nr:conserved Plasmodium protein, unknown function [Plasmodium berghei ANKA]CXI84270.1 conserved Plasmodium protein, unknown function [Plasmodium berghei]SCM25771.1 conserved Plasmodium protein, unknown function [Plasmodium berghei]SCN27490.1 conserved Plasmodium protein, unknown function [Plasmodium berghei]SCO62214.1 conserved Plasmodium protein, unknown function [Plasmodium berghei]SCO63917.1 conserved Plasmodium protein, unknown function [Plasmodium berghei]|eukprot:XP_034423122.1 conserved Plasmodium protein, unknown function [Plasmodium berghei ANKA]
MIRKIPKNLHIYNCTTTNDICKGLWIEYTIKKAHIHSLSKINYSFVQKKKNVINKNIYNMTCVELYRYSCLLKNENINNITIYNQINKRVEMIYKFLTPSKIILLIKLYLENINLNAYKNTFNCLIETAIQKLTQFNIEEIVKLYSIIGNVENNEMVVYLLKYFNNHLIKHYTFVDIKSFSIILNAHAKLKIKDMKLINKFLHIIIQNNLSFDIINYSIFFNAFYKLKITDNEYVTEIVNMFLKEIDIFKKHQYNISLQIDQKDNNINDAFINYYPHHICNILLYFSIYDINKIDNSTNNLNLGNDVKDYTANQNDGNKNGKTESENPGTHCKNNGYISFLLDLLIKKKKLIKCEEILMICQIFKSLKIKNDILINHIENELLKYFNQYGKEKKYNHNKNNNTKENNTGIFSNDNNNALIKILFDMCTFYNDISIYTHSIQYFRYKQKLDYYSSLLLLYVYSEINLLNHDVITFLINIIKKNYFYNFSLENSFLLIRSFYKILLNNQNYYPYLNQQKEEGEGNAQNNDQPTIFNTSKQTEDITISKNNCYNNSIDISLYLKNIFYKIDNLSDKVFKYLENELFDKKDKNKIIYINEYNIIFICKILYYCAFLRRYAFLNKIIPFFINKENEITGFKNILNILYAYSYIKKNLYHINIHKLNIIQANDEYIKNTYIRYTNDIGKIVDDYNFIINKRNYNTQIKNIIYFYFIQCKFNDYRYVNIDNIYQWIGSSFLNIHLLSILLNISLAKELNLITRCAKRIEENVVVNKPIEKIDENIKNDNSIDIKTHTHMNKEHTNSDAIIVMKIDSLNFIKMYHKIFTEINKLILNCKNIYDITRIFNSSFIILNYLEKLKSEQKINDDDIKMERAIHIVLKKIERNIIQNYNLYDKEFIMLLTAICIYNNNYYYIPFALFFTYFNKFVFKNYISYLILLSNDEEIKYLSNECLFISGYKDNNSDYHQSTHLNNISHSFKHKENIKFFYNFHLSNIINKINIACNTSQINKNIEVNNTINDFSTFNTSQIISIYKLMVSNNELLACNDFFKKIKDIYLESIENNFKILESLSLYDLNQLCLYILKKNAANLSLFKYTIKKNYEHIQSKTDRLLKYDYIISILNISIKLKKYNLFINNSIIIDIVLKNSNEFDTLQKINYLLEYLVQIQEKNIYDNVTANDQLFQSFVKVYFNYFLNNRTIDLNNVVYFLYLLKSFNQPEIFYYMFQVFYYKFFKLNKISISQKKKYQFSTSLNNPFYIIKNIYSLNHQDNVHDATTYLSNSPNDEYIIHLNNNTTNTDINNIENVISSSKNKIGYPFERDIFSEKYTQLKGTTNDETPSNFNQSIGTNDGNSIQCKKNEASLNIEFIIKKIIESDEHDVIYINDHSFITLYFLLNLNKNEKYIKHAELYSFLFSIFKNNIYMINKEVAIQCLYIYLYSQINEQLSGQLTEHCIYFENINNPFNDQIKYILNILITFIHNLDIGSILKLAFFYINVFFNEHKHKKANYRINENIKIIFDHINKKKNLIEKNNILYEQVKKAEGIPYS